MTRKKSSDRCSVDYTGATLSACRTYRYGLWRGWKHGWTKPYFAMFIGLNPSTADEKDDDPTIRRCIRYAHDWGYRGLWMANLFAYRATTPKEMKTAKNPIGEANDQYLVSAAAGSGVVIAAWGVNGGYLGRDEEVKKLIPSLSVLKLTKDGYPSHPLYLRRNLTPMSWSLLNGVKYAVKIFGEDMS